MLGFSQLKKGHFNGIADEGNSLRQKLAFRAEFVENTKLAKKLRKSAQSAINKRLTNYERLRTKK